VLSFSDFPLIPALLTALGVGLLIGMVRERQHSQSFAGVRTHALTALASALAASLGIWPLMTVLTMVVILVSLTYWRSSAHDPGLTGEVAMMLTALLGALSITDTVLAAGLGALTAGLLYAKTPLHRFTREVLSEREVQDGIILLASALIILPMLPDRAIDPYGVLNLAKLWRLVVLVMLVGAIAHIALRLIGNRWGLPLAGFFSGYVSSTAATLHFTQTARKYPGLAKPALSAALLANAASISLFVPILLAISPALLSAIRWELTAAIASLAIMALAGIGKSNVESAADSPVAQKRMFHFRDALMLVAIITAVLLLSAVLNHWLGPKWAIAMSLLAAAAELHAGLIGLAQLVQNGTLTLEQSHWGIFGLVAISALTKTIIAWVAGNSAFALRFGLAMLVMLMVMAGTSVIAG
jgi:uncharacterized membrane protein (DUF4010 family)